MVSYQTLVGIAYDVVDAKGAQFDGISDGQTVIEIVAEEWSQNKEEYRGLTEKQARSRLNRVLEVN